MSKVIAFYKGGSKLYVAWQVLERMINIELANGKYGVYISPALILKFASLESFKAYTTETVFVSNYCNSSGFCGVFQFNAASWSAASTWRIAHGLPALGSFVSSWADPKQNTLACMAYMMINANSLVAHKYPITAETLYSSHNLGAAGFRKYVSSPVRRSKESRAAQMIHADARAQVLNRSMLAKASVGSVRPLA